MLTGLLIEVGQGLIPFILALAAGAMIYVVSDEVIPETHKYGHEDVATIGFVTGFITMLLLDSLV